MGTKQAIFLPFLISCTRAHFRMAELGCLASIPLQKTSSRVRILREPRSALATYIFSSTMPLACEHPANGFLYSLHMGQNTFESRPDRTTLAFHSSAPAQVAPVVVLVGPTLLTAVHPELAPSSHSTCLTAKYTRRRLIIAFFFTRRISPRSYNPPHVAELVELPFREGRKGRSAAEGD